MSLPRCACGFQMPGPLHGADCWLYLPKAVYVPLEARVARLEAEVAALATRCRTLLDVAADSVQAQADLVDVVKALTDRLDAEREQVRQLAVRMYRLMEPRMRDADPEALAFFAREVSRATGIPTLRPVALVASPDDDQPSEDASP